MEGELGSWETHLHRDALGPKQGGESPREPAARCPGGRQRLTSHGTNKSTLRKPQPWSLAPCVYTGKCGSPLAV